MTGKLRVGVIGLGMGRNHIAGYQAHPGAEVVAIADIDKARLIEIGDRYTVPRRYDTADEMLARETLDVISIATPNLFHHPMTLAAFKAGCHVLCEKPMALNAVEAREMLAAAQAAGKRLMIDFSYRFNEQSMMLKKQVDFAPSAKSILDAPSGTAGADCQVLADGLARKRSLAAVL